MRSYGVLATASCVILVMACAKGSVGGDGYPSAEGNGPAAGQPAGATDPGTGEQSPELTGDPIEPPADPSEPPVADSGAPKTDGSTPATDSGSPAPSCGTTPPSNKCGLLPQCGCAATETCDVKDTAGNVSCVAAGTAGMGRACTSTAGCEKGLTCAFGTCHAYCNGTCSIPGTNTCYQLQQNNVPVPNFKVCQITCDLRDANSCGGTNAAGPAGCVPDGAGATDCELVGTAQVGQTCSGTAAAPNCAAGLTCVQLANSSKICKKWCRVGTTDCGGASTCTGFSTKIKVGAVEYGVCP
jgi:hypothetical protein